jgi:hypothetical protein
MPDNVCWIGFLAVPDGGSCIIPGEDDTLVEVNSLRSSHGYIPLGPPLPMITFNY